MKAKKLTRCFSLSLREAVRKLTVHKGQELGLNLNDGNLFNKDGKNLEF